jgi:hypothetical protein
MKKNETDKMIAAAMPLTTRRKAILFIRKEGFYNYAKSVEQMRAQSEDYFERHYSESKEKVLAAHESVFEASTAGTYTVDTFLHNVRNVTNWGLNPELDKRSTVK